MSTDEKKEVATPSSDAYEQRVAALARRLRHIGFAIFGGIALATVLFLSYCIVMGIHTHHVFDPFTGEAVSEPGEH